MNMFRSKTAKQKPLQREPSRGPAAYDSRPTPASPVRPLGRALSDGATSPGVEPNTLVVAVDFGNSPHTAFL
jgi:hypothetical protein